MNILVYDNDVQNQESIKKKINELYKDFKIFYYNNVHDLLFDIKHIQGCIIFINITQDSKNKIELSNKIHKTNKTIQIIFYSYQELTIDIYEGTHMYYLSLPNDEDKIDKAIELALKKLDNLFFKFSFAKISYRVPIEDILYFESSARIIKIYTTKDTKIYYDRLDNIEKIINYPFVRASKSFLINPLYITKIEDKKITLKKVPNLEASTEICISKSYWGKLELYKAFKS